MIGELQEISIAVEQLESSAQQLLKLGFTANEALPTANEDYIAVSLAELTIGLHLRREPELELCFIRPNLVAHLRALRHHRIHVDHASTADDEFHRATFSDPSGLPIQLLEARTCLPGRNDATAISPLGQFSELSVCGAELHASVSFWETLGLTQISEKSWHESHVHLEGRGIALGVHQQAYFAPGISFTCADLATRCAFLEASGCELKRVVPFAAMRGVTIAGPLPIYMLERDAG